MKSIRREDVPDYLRNGGLFQALDADDHETFEVPTDWLKPDENVQTKEDLFFLLRSLQFWQVANVPVTAQRYIYMHEEFSVGTEFPLLALDIRSLGSIKEASPEKRIRVALESKYGAEMVRWLHKHTPCELSADTCSAAAAAGDLESMAYLHECGCPWDASTIREAILTGSIDCLEYAQGHGCPALSEDERPLSLAARKGHIRMIRYLRNRGEQWDEHTMSNSIHAEGLACMQYLHQAGCPWKESCCMCASLIGRLDCLQYAHEHGCPWDLTVLIVAALRGNLNCLQYAHEQGCEWISIVTYSAVQGNHLTCLKYAHEHGCPFHDKTTRLALLCGHWRCLYYAMRNGADCTILVLLCFQTIPWVMNAINLYLYSISLYEGNSSVRLSFLTSLFVMLLLSGSMSNSILQSMSAELAMRIDPVNLQRMQCVAMVSVLSGVALMLYTVYLFFFHYAWLRMPMEGNE